MVIIKIALVRRWDAKDHMLNISMKPHRSSLKAGSTAEQKVFVMLKVSPDVEAGRSRPPIALALVVDTSTSMAMFADQDAARAYIAEQHAQGEQAINDGGEFHKYKIQLPTLSDQAVDAAHALIDDPRLQPGDLISIIHFDDHAHVLLPLTPAADKKRAHEAIESLRTFEGGTCMADGLRCALAEFRTLGPQVAKRALVFTDGAASDEEQCDALLSSFAATNTPIIGIGVGREYRRELLERMADATQGRPYHLARVTELGAVLHRELSQTAREVVTDLKLRVSLINGVRLDAVTRIFPSLSDVSIEAPPYRLGNVAAGDDTVFLLELTVAGAERPPRRVRLGQLHLVATAAATGRTREFAPQEIIATFTHDAAALAVIDDEVMGYVQQKGVGRLVKEAMREVPTNSAQARRHLETAYRMTQRLGNDSMTHLLHGSLSELERTGSISSDTHKTVVLGMRTNTTKAPANDDPATTAG